MLALLVVPAAAAAFWIFGTEPKAIRIDASNAALIAGGKQLYGQQCGSCHGVKLEGQPNWMERKPDGKLAAPPHDSAGHTWHHSDGDLLVIVKKGMQPFAGPDYKTDMPRFEGILNDDQIGSILAYIKSTWPERVRKYQERVTEQAADRSGGVK
jgi:mono/diheme cytochrome c family protein